MDEPKSRKPEFSTFATATTAVNAAYATNVVGKNPLNQEIANCQLSYWMEAKRIYSERVKSETAPLLTDLMLVVSHLGNSLLHLFGRSFPNPHGDNTPSLLAYVDHRDHRSGFDLEQENRTLYVHLVRLNDFCNNVAKHTDQSKEEKAYSLDKPLIEEFLQTTKEVWLWYGKHKYSGRIPADQVKEFSEDYCVLK